MNVAPVTLEGRYVRLEPMTIEHAEPLARVGLDPELWRLQPAPIETAGDMEAYVREALDLQRRGSALPFVIVERGTGEVIGSTRYMDIAPAHRRLEIGATWITPSRQRSGANTEAKRMLLAHAFEALGAIRVVFKTEAGNERSRRALRRIGAVEEGTFRQHLIARSGRRRDMVYFAILESEWPAVRERLAGLLR
ncbi:MAG TPA: GNAT family protein [Thermoanaerobaculia bacterium]|nr:GNAT family protein [Thermoanaerobaculia bacterium]